MRQMSTTFRSLSVAARGLRAHRAIARAVLSSALLSSALLSTGCIIVRGNGNVVTEEVPVDGAIAHIVNSTSIDMNLTGGDEDTVQIECDENLLDYVDVSVIDGAIDVQERSPATVAFSGPCRVHVTASALRIVQARGSGDVTARGSFDALEEIATSGSSDIDIAGIDAEALRLSTSGSGNITAAGTAESATITVSGSGDVHAAELRLADVEVHSTGSGNVQCHASDTAALTLTGSGDVTLSGGAEITAQTTTGSGEVHTR